MLQYQLDFLPPTSPGFTYSAAGVASGATPGKQVAVASAAIPPIMSERIQIVTENADGVVPHSHAPPGYVRPEGEGDYNNSVGYLENGNQRFYHHHPGF